MPAARILQPNFYVAFMSCNVSRETLLLGKSPESGSARLGHIPSLPWESQLPLKPCISLHPSDFEGNCDSSDFLLDFCCSFIVQFDLLRKCGLLAHTSPTFLKNCWIKKLFFCLRLVIENISPRKTIRIRFGKVGAHPQLALGIAIAPETLFSHYNLLILKAIAILSICS